MLELTGLTKTYRSEDVETTALDHVSLKIDAGEFVAIMGPSGCGKSTLLSIIGMLDAPSSGRYEFEGVDISRYSEALLADLRKRRLSFIFQSFNLIDDLTVQENIELALLYQRVSGAERARRVGEVMDRVGIAHRARHRPPQLSGGQQQRVAVARALVSKPALILADEPTGNLDSAHGTDVMRMLRDLNDQGATILMVTHSAEHANHARRIVNMLDGRILTERRGLSRLEPEAA